MFIILTAKTFVEPLDMPFSRRGSYICFANANGGSSALGQAQLWLATSRMRPSDRNNGNILADNHFRQMQLELVKDGSVQECVISTTPYELIFECALGSIRFCIGDYKYAECKGADGLTLRIKTTAGVSGPITSLPAIDLLDGSWKTNFGNYFMLFVPSRGTIQLGPEGAIELVPDDKGVIELVMEESLVDPKRRTAYRTYNACVATVKDDFDGFAERIAPALPERYRERGQQALWTLWGLTVVPDIETVYRHQMVKMIRSSFEAAFSWQQGTHAFFLSAHDYKFAWELLLSCFDAQDSTGRIADALTYKGAGETMKPPVQGLGLLWLMELYELSDLPKEELEYLWNGMEKWTKFHLEFRDLDHDGIIENQNAGETGWECPSYFSIGFPLASPDINAYLVLQMEALAKLGGMIGKSEKICAYWANKASDTVQKIIDMFWTEDGWTAVNIITKERAGTTSMVPNCTLVLGRRLPQAIIDKTISNIFDQPGFNTPYGLTSENQNSPRFMNNWSLGSIDTPIEALMVVGLESCGRTDLAKKVAAEYLDLLMENRMMHIHNSKNGQVEDQSFSFFTEKALFNSGWTAGCFIFLAEYYGD